MIRIQKDITKLCIDRNKANRPWEYGPRAKTRVNGVKGEHITYIVIMHW